LRLTRLIGLGGLVALGGAALWIGGRGPAALESHGYGSGRGLPGTPPSARAVELGYETEDMSGRDMALVGLGLAVSAAVAVGLMVLLLAFFHAADRDHPPYTAMQLQHIETPLPHLQTDPIGDLQRERAREDKLLSGYAWVDRAHTRAHIPIARAMALTVGQSLDTAP
jgi:hypothetical protein